MSEIQAWLAATATVGVLIGYEITLALAQRRDPQRLARSAHAVLREDWFAALSMHKGSELLAVQTLRNSLMSATLTASTAALALMGSVTLAAPSLHANFVVAPAGGPVFSARLALELALMALLFTSLLCSAMAVRYYNHASFIGSMPVESELRRRWSNAGVVYVRRAGLLYSWGLRNLILVAPIIAAIVHPAAGPVAALLVVAVLSGFDRVEVGSPP
ncbi:MAG: hypothetical protein RLZZ598_997 [Pseudomonadota bacterium]|jgi:hypothetical protein